MDEAANPYSPGAGLRPAVIAGRQSEQHSFTAALARASRGAGVRGMMLTGLRGVGKTVLLNELANEADRADWLTARLEVSPDGTGPLLATLVRDLAAGMRRSFGGRLSDAARRAAAAVTSLSVTVDPGGSWRAAIDLDTGKFDTSGTGDLETDLTSAAVELGRAAAERGIGAAVFVDELQETDRAPLAALIAAAHACGQRAVPFVVSGAGLPNLPGRLAEARSYAERLFDYRPLGSLGADSAAALAGPAAATGVSWDADALAHVCEAAGGYPYFLQEFGAATWNVAPGPVITARDARVGVRLGLAILDGGFFRSRWDRATPTERSYLQAMAALDTGAGACRTPDVAQEMGRTLSNLGPIRAGLIGKGLVYAPEYGVVAFTVPGMAAFIRRQYDNI